MRQDRGMVLRHCTFTECLLPFLCNLNKFPSAGVMSQTKENFIKGCNSISKQGRVKVLVY